MEEVKQTIEEKRTISDIIDEFFKYEKKDKNGKTIEDKMPQGIKGNQRVIKILENLKKSNPKLADLKIAIESKRTGNKYRLQPTDYNDFYDMIDKLEKSGIKTKNIFRYENDASFEKVEEPKQEQEEKANEPEPKEEKPMSVSSTERQLVEEMPKVEQKKRKKRNSKVKDEIQQLQQLSTEQQLIEGIQDFGPKNTEEIKKQLNEQTKEQTKEPAKEPEKVKKMDYYEKSAIEHEKKEDKLMESLLVDPPPSPPAVSVSVPQLVGQTKEEIKKQEDGLGTSIIEPKESPTVKLEEVDGEIRTVVQDPIEETTKTELKTEVVPEKVEVETKTETEAMTETLAKDPEDPEPETGPLVSPDQLQNSLTTDVQNSTTIIPVKRYHPTSLLLYFGSKDKPNWDSELLINVLSLKLTKNEIADFIDLVIKTYGPKIFVTQRKSETLEELNEVVQLQFCVMRSLNRGTRFATANIKVSDLASLASSGKNAEQGPKMFVPKVIKRERPVEDVFIMGNTNQTVENNSVSGGINVSYEMSYL